MSCGVWGLLFVRITNNCRVTNKNVLLCSKWRLIAIIENLAGGPVKYATSAEQVTSTVAVHNVTVIGLFRDDGRSGYSGDKNLHADESTPIPDDSVQSRFLNAAKAHDHGSDTPLSLCWVAVQGDAAEAVATTFGVPQEESDAAIILVKKTRLDLWPQSPNRVVQASAADKADVGAVRAWATENSKPFVVQMQSMIDYPKAFPAPTVSKLINSSDSIDPSIPLHIGCIDLQGYGLGNSSTTLVVFSSASPLQDLQAALHKAAADDKTVEQSWQAVMFWADARDWCACFDHVSFLRSSFVGSMINLRL